MAFISFLKKKLNLITLLLVTVIIVVLIPIPRVSAATAYSVEDAALMLRNDMIQRKSTITIVYQTAEFLSTQEEMDNLVFNIKKHALEHTGKGYEGDYLQFHLANWNATVTAETVNGGYSYTICFQIGYMSTYNQEMELQAKINELISSLELDDKSDYEKVERIYDYMCDHIYYDYSHLNDPSYIRKYSAYAALIDRTAVCQGYANLFYRLALTAGLDARIITGTSQGEAHAWNIVRIDGKYYNVDATWDSSSDEYAYFLKSEANFPDHEREAAYSDATFMERYPIADENCAPPREEVITRGEFTYRVYGNTATLVKYNGTSTDITIPETVDGCIVTEIGASAFTGNSTLTSVTLPACIKRIEDGYLDQTPYPYVSEGAFSRCTKLKTVTIPADSKLTYIGKFTFADCVNLKKITLPSSVKELAMSTFECCSALSTLALPEGLTRIGQNALTRTALTALHIPASCTDFHWANSLYSLQSFSVATGNPRYRAHEGVLYDNCPPVSGYTGWTLVGYPVEKPEKTYRVPVFCTHIWGDAVADRHPSHLEKLYIENCASTSSLTEDCSISRFRCEVIPSESNPYFTQKNGCLFSRDGKTLLQIPSSVTGTVIVPNGVKIIGEYAAEHGAYEKVILPEGLEEIKGAAFWQTPTLKEINLPNSLQALGSSVFQECSSLESIVIPDGITAIKVNTFACCYNLKTITLPATIAEIEYQAFVSVNPNKVIFRGTCAQWGVVNIGSQNAALTTIGMVVCRDSPSATTPTQPTSPTVPTVPTEEPMQPTVPTTPTVPTDEPTQPTAPTIPTVPTDEPTQPTVPTTPTVPTEEPTQPTVPTTPTVPTEEPTQPTAPTELTGPTEEVTQPPLPTAPMASEENPGDKGGAWIVAITIFVVFSGGIFMWINKPLWRKILNRSN